MVCNLYISRIVDIIVMMNLCR